MSTEKQHLEAFLNTLAAQGKALGDFVRFHRGKAVSIELDRQSNPYFKACVVLSSALSSLYEIGAQTMFTLATMDLESERAGPPTVKAEYAGSTVDGRPRAFDHEGRAIRFDEHGRPIGDNEPGFRRMSD